MMEDRDIEQLKLIFSQKQHLHTGSDTPRLDYRNLQNIPDLVKFGGDGSDGVLSINSGTTTLALGGVAVFSKNYSEISITGTGQLAFSGPSAGGTVVVLRCSGNVTITSSTTPTIDISGLGPVGGSGTNNNNSQNGGGSGGGGGGGASGAGTAGSAGGATNATAGGAGGGNFPFIKNYFAGGGGGGSMNNGGPAGTSAGVSDNIYESVIGKYFLVCGAGGGGGQGHGSFAPPNNVPGTGGTGGTGSGALYIECAGGWNFTGTIYAKGNQGGSASWSISGAGGGGGGGSVVVKYNILISNTGTITTTGGIGGAAGTPGGTGGNGYSKVSKNLDF